MTAVDSGAISARPSDAVSFSVGGLWNVCGACGAVVASEHAAVHAAWHDELVAIDAAARDDEATLTAVALDGSTSA